MKTSRTKFVSIFLIGAFAFLFFTTGVLNQEPEAFLGNSSQQGWQSAVSTIVSPLKVLLLGPMLPFIKFLNQDPDAPPPFFLIGFAIYWTFLAIAIHYLLRKFRTTV